MDIGYRSGDGVKDFNEPRILFNAAAHRKRLRKQPHHPVQFLKPSPVEIHVDGDTLKASELR